MRTVADSLTEQGVQQDMWTGLEYIEAVLRYVITAAPIDNISYEDLWSIVDESLPHIGGEIMRTIADSLIEQGVQQGIQQGILEAAKEAVLDSLEVRFEVVPQSIAETLSKITDPSILRILHRKAMKVATLEEFGHLLDLMIQ